MNSKTEVHFTDAKVESRALQMGFTLPEVMISVSILAGLMVSVFAGMAIGWAVINTSRQDLRATQILTQKIESIRLLTWAQLTNQCPFTFRETYDSLSQTNGSGLWYFGRVSLGTATNIPSTCNYRDDVRLVTLSLSWTNNFGRSPVVHNRQMQTLASKNGIQQYIWGIQ